jgi:HAD superfamily hydrolase (TIGR01509 family)
LAAPPRWRNELSRFAAVIFDMDGVLVDGEPLHFRAINELLGPEGKALTLEQYKPYMGTKAGWTEFITDFKLAHPREHYYPLYHELILAQYRTELVALPGAIAAVEAARASGVPVGLASSSVRPWVEACLAGIGLADAFDALTTGDEIENGKPAPDIYLLAARRLGVEPSRCLAIEDAPAGIAAAKAAGMTCWAVHTEYTRDLDLGAPDRVLGSLLELEAGDLVGVAV